MSLTKFTYVALCSTIITIGTGGAAFARHHDDNEQVKIAAMKSDHSMMTHSEMDHSKMMAHAPQPVTAKSAIKIHMAWSGALPPVATNGAVYLMVHNYSSSDDQIIAASTPIANRVQFHASETKNGTITMSHQTSIDLKAGGAVTFKPGSQHLMLMGLKKPLVTGNSFPLTLVLKKAGPVTVMVKVKPLL